jgi:hypothetical protein
MAAYDAYLSGDLPNHEMPEEELRRSLAGLPKV